MDDTLLCSVVVDVLQFAAVVLAVRVDIEAVCVVAVVVEQAGIQLEPESKHFKISCILNLLLAIFTG